MSMLADVLAVLNSPYGWLAAVIYLAYLLYAPVYLDRDTILAPLVRDIPEKVDDVVEKQEGLRSDVDDVQHHQEMVMNVQRAQARANDSMDEQRVDEYLLENGVRPDEFLTSNIDTRYRADGHGTTINEHDSDGDTDDEGNGE